jgi:hypothetical protein
MSRNRYEDIKTTLDNKAWDVINADTFKWSHPNEKYEVMIKIQNIKKSSGLLDKD